MTKLALLRDISTICVTVSAIVVTIYLGFSLVYVGLAATTLA